MIPERGSMRIWSARSISTGGPTPRITRSATSYRVIEEGPGLRWVVTRFGNYDRHDEVRFRFVRQDGRWYLDDAMQGTGRGDDGWTLSELLQRPRNDRAREVEMGTGNAYLSPEAYQMCTRCSGGR